MPNSDKQAKQMEISRTVLICIILAVVTFVAFEQVRNNGFVNYDDNNFITDNDFVQNGLNRQSIAWAFTTGRTSNWYPLTWISHIIDCSVFGPDPAGHHLVSVGFHIANVILLFLIFKKMTRAIWPSAFVAALFAVHPLSVESVAWVAERKNVLSNFFAFLTIWAYLWYSRKPGLWRYMVIVILFAAGLLSKSMLVTLPFVLVLLDYWPIGRFGAATGLKWLWSATIEKVPLLVMSVALCVVTYMAQARTGTLPGTSMLPMGLRVSNALESYIKYIAMTFYPAKLAVLYPLESDGFDPMAVAGCFVLLLLVTIVAIAMRRKRGFLFTGWFWYLGTLVPVIGLIQVGVQSMADRYMYLPGIGIYIIVAWLASEAAAKLRLPKAVPVVTGAAILVVLLLITRIQVGYWKDSESLSRHALDVTSNNAMMNYSYGDALMVSGRLDEAIEQFRKTLSMRPAFVDVREKLAGVLQAKGRNAEAVPELEMVLKARPDDTRTRNNYGVALIETGLYDKAIEQFSQVLAADPYHLNALNNLYKAGVEGGKLDKVLDVILNLQAKAPNNFNLYEKAGLIYGTKGNINAAITQLETACRLTDYRQAEPLDFLSQAYAAQKDTAKAVETAQKALDAANGQGNQQLAEQISKRLELYKQNSPQEK